MRNLYYNIHDLIKIEVISNSQFDTNDNLRYAFFKTEEKGELIFVELSIKNNGKRLPLLEIVDEIPDICTVNEGSNHWFLELKKNEEVDFSYAIQCHKRGRYTIGPVLVKGSDVFNFR